MLFVVLMLGSPPLSLTFSMEYVFFPQFFSTALPPAVCAAALQSLLIVKSEPERRHKLQQHNQLARTHAKSLGLTVYGDGRAPVVAVRAPESRNIVTMSQQLQNEGWLGWEFRRWQQGQRD